MKYWKPVEAQDVLSSLAEFSTNMLARISPEGLYLYVSPSAARIFGRPVDEVVGKHVLDYVYEEDQAVFWSAAEGFKANKGETFDVTMRVWHADNSLRWVEVSSRLIGDPVRGKARDWATIIRDITDHKNR